MDPTAAATPVLPQSGTMAEALKGFTLIGGDWVLWILVFASVLSVTVMIERLIYFWRNRTPVERFIEPFAERLNRGDIKGAAALADVTKGAEARIAKVALANFDEGEQAVEQMMASRKVTERLRFERYLMVNASGSPTYPNPITPTVAWSEASRCFKSSPLLMSLGPPAFPCSRSAPVCLKNVAARNRRVFALRPSIRGFLRRPRTLIASESAELVDFGAPWRSTELTGRRRCTAKRPSGSSVPRSGSARMAR